MFKDKALFLLVCTVIPGKPVISSQPAGVMEDNTSFTLVCQSPSELENTTYVWSRNGVEIAHSEGSLSQTAKITDPANYTCKVSGDGGNQFSVTSNVFVVKGKFLKTFLKGKGKNTVTVASSKAQIMSFRGALT